MKYLWTHPKTKKLYVRIQIRQKDGKYKTCLKAARSEIHAAALAREMMLEMIFKEAPEMSFDEFRQRIEKLYER